MDPRQIHPPDDSGSQTVDRFCYEAYVALPLCVLCAAGNEVEFVYLEHIEDIAVCTTSGWRFIQVKTRNPERGPWRLSDMIGADGAFHSLVRTFRKVGDVNCTLEAHLEGVIASGDPLRAFAARSRDEAAILSQADVLKNSLGLTDVEVGDFSAKLTVVAGLPPRSHIDDSAMAMLAKSAPDARQEDVQNALERLLFAIHTAMRAAGSSKVYPDCITHPAETTEDAARLQAKTLSPEVLEPLFGPLRPRPGAVLFFDGPGRSGGSALGDKLRVGGAPERIVDDAKLLRASASHREYEVLAVNATLLKDVQTKIRLRGNAVAARHASHARPAVEIWAELMAQLPGQVATIDPHRLFQQDPDLLLGELCELSDMCEFDWGVAE